MPKGIYNHKQKDIDFYIDNNGCHICTSHSLGIDGYPQIQKDRKHYNLHRYVYEQINGIQDKNVFIRHTCDNRKCINPNHLIPGSSFDNSNDMVIRGRSAKGSKNGNSKLDEIAIKKIRKSSLSNHKIADEYGVSRQLISMIRSNKIWNHV